MKIYKDSPEGNAWVIMGYVSRLLKEAKRGDEWPDIQRKMMSGDYENLCKIAKEATFGSIEIV